ncbi:hypothetical protein Gpo141_00008390 [Globisporangium polare]
MFFSTSAKPSLKDEAAGDVTEEPASIAHFTQSSTIHPLTGTPAAPVPNEMTATAGASSDPIWQNPVPHEVYNLDVIAHIGKTHHEPKLMYEKAALFAVKTVRSGFDLVSGYRGPGGRMTELDWLHRCLFLETVAGVPGMVAGMARHLRSLRSLKRDYGWIHTLLEEAENERMHLLIFMNMKQPGWMFRTMVLGAQGVFFNVFFVAYLVSPRTCHRFVGYLEEEAVKTYTGLLKDIEDGHLKEWQAKQAPLIARSYYNLPESATVFDMVKCVRADEANHRDVNHTFADLDQEKGVNPYMLKHKK